jgi:uncharacterized protein (DUF1501 family)
VSELAELYRAHDHALLRGAAEHSFGLARALAEARASGVAATGAGYPEGSAVGRSLREIAHLIQLDVGLRVVFAESRTSPDESGTWDTRANAAPLDGPFPAMASDLAASLAAFWRDLGSACDDVALVILTDFGRHVVENARLGTDHGRATAMFLLGTAVRGSAVYGSLPKRLDRDALEDGMDLRVTTDFRAVLSTLTAAQLGVRDDARVLPGSAGEPLRLLAGESTAAPA